HKVFNSLTHRLVNIPMNKENYEKEKEHIINLKKIIFQHKIYIQKSEKKKLMNFEIPDLNVFFNVGVVGFTRKRLVNVLSACIYVISG
ncbi:hypothetical protein L9F63_012780, partial [Diploptera punctata]